MTIGKLVAMVDSIARAEGTIDYALNFELPKMLCGRSCEVRTRTPAY